MCWRAIAQAQRERSRPSRPLHRPRQLLQRSGNAAAGLLRPRNQVTVVAPRQPSAIRCLPWQPAERSTKSLRLVRGLARTMSARPSPGTSGQAASKSATGSYTRAKRQRRRNTQRSDSEWKEPLFCHSRPEGFDALVLNPGPPRGRILRLSRWSDAVEPLRVIGAAMAEAGVVGLGRLTLSRRERTVMVEPRGAGVALFTLRAAEEVRAAQQRRFGRRNSASPAYHSIAPRGTDGLQTPCWRSQSRARPVSEARNSLLAGKIQGILFVGAFECYFGLAGN